MTEILILHRFRFFHPKTLKDFAYKMKKLKHLKPHMTLNSEYRYIGYGSKLMHKRYEKFQCTRLCVFFVYSEPKRKSIRFYVSSTYLCFRWFSDFSHLPFEIAHKMRETRKHRELNKRKIVYFFVWTHCNPFTKNETMKR